MQVYTCMYNVHVKIVHALSCVTSFVFHSFTSINANLRYMPKNTYYWHKVDRRKEWKKEKNMPLNITRGDKSRTGIIFHSLVLLRALLERGYYSREGFIWGNTVLHALMYKCTCAMHIVHALSCVTSFVFHSFTCFHKC